MQLVFSGRQEAEWFTREVRESLAGVLAKNCHWPEHPGFVSASVDGRFWWDTMWTRDAGVFLREMAHWGYFEQGLATLKCLFRQVQPNQAGYRMFPEHLKPGEPGAGSELDGTAAILIGGALLWERLPQADPARQEIWEDLTGPGSPVQGLLAALRDSPLLAGSGEFGGGSDIHSQFYNVVQNHLVHLALLAVGRMAAGRGEPSLANACREAAQQVLEGMLAELRYPDGSWMWNRRAPDMRIDWEVLEHQTNAGFGGLNGVLSMSNDVLGLLPDRDETWVGASVNTFLRLLSHPMRLSQFTRYGMWTQFDRYNQGLQSGPSYGHGYAVQVMQLLDLPELYTPAIHWLARATLETLPGQIIVRDSLYWFYERYFSPEAVGKIELEEGCGALNLVCVMEPLKIARLILGLDDHDPQHLRLVPRLPLGWQAVDAQRVPVLTPQGVVYADIQIAAETDGTVQQVTLQADQPLSGLQVRLGRAQRPAWKRLPEASSGGVEL